MTDLLHRPPDRLGWRGAVLFLAGVLFFVMGLDVIVHDTEYVGGSALWHEALPKTFRIAAWTTCGLVAIGCAWLRKPWADSVGWGFALVMPAERAASYWTAWVWSWFTTTGVPDAWPQALAWTTVTAFLYTSARALRNRNGHDPDAG